MYWLFLKQQLKQSPLKMPSTYAGETTGIHNLRPRPTNAIKIILMQYLEKGWYFLIGEYRFKVSFSYLEVVHLSALSHHAQLVSAICQELFVVVKGQLDFP